jgi:hypothetical protein
MPVIMCYLLHYGGQVDQLVRSAAVECVVIDSVAALVCESWSKWALSVKHIY